MAARVEITNIDDVLRGLDKTSDQVREAAKYAIGMAGLAVERQAKRNASTGVHKRGLGHIQGTGPGPNVVTGNLRRSIMTKVDGYNISSGAMQRSTLSGFGDRYVAEISAGAVYARAVEKGLPEWGGVKYPYLEPAAVRLSNNGTLRRVFITNLALRMRG
jgi:hypothetical protein